MAKGVLVVFMLSLTYVCCQDTPECIDATIAASGCLSIISAGNTTVCSGNCANLIATYFQECAEFSQEYNLLCSNNNDDDDNNTQACSTAFALVLANSRCATTGQMLTAGTISREDAAVILCSEPCRTLGQDAVDACRGVDSNEARVIVQGYSNICGGADTLKKLGIFSMLLMAVITLILT